MAHRLLTGVAAAALTGTALILPASDAWGAACVFADDPVHSKLTISADCELSATQVVPDGYTLDGNNHTITVDGSTFAGPAILSAAAPSGSTPTLMKVNHLHIEASNFGGTAILFDGAIGSVQHSTIAAGSGASGDVGIAVQENGVTFGQDKVLISDVQISDFRSIGVFASGNVGFNVLNGSRISKGGNGADGIQARDLAHGKIQDSSIALNEATPGDATHFGTGVHLIGSRRVEIKRNVVTGDNADLGVMIEDSAASSGVSGKVTAAIECTAFIRHEQPGDTDDFYGLGVAERSDQTKANAVISESTFTGWKRAASEIDAAGAVGDRIDQGPSAQPPSCPVGKPANVSAKGGDHSSRVTWKAANAPAYAPVTRYTVTAEASGRPAITRNVSGTVTSTTLTGLNNTLTYTVTVRARNASSTAAASDKLFPTALTLGGHPRHITKGQKTTLKGVLSSKDPNARLGNRTIRILAKPVGGSWRQVGTARTTSTGAYSLGVRPGKKTTYQARYDGAPDLASRRLATVFVTS